jgi:hypothetical protein
MSLDNAESSSSHNNSSYRQNTEFVIQKEDFPALSSFASDQSDRGNKDNKSASHGMSSSNDVMLQRHQQQVSNSNASIGSRSGALNSHFGSSGFQRNNLSANSFPPLNSNDMKQHVSCRYICSCGYIYLFLMTCRVMQK